MTEEELLALEKKAKCGNYRSCGPWENRDGCGYGGIF